MLFNLLMYVFMAVMIVRIISMNAQRKKNFRTTELLRNVNDSAMFNEIADRLEQENQKDIVFLNELKVFRLWEQAMNRRYDAFRKSLEEINLNDYISEGRKGMEVNEVAFFYLLHTIPNIFYGQEDEEMRKLVAEKVETVREKLSNQMIWMIYEANEAMYDGSPEKAVPLYEKILDGDYEGIAYGKSMISVYKKICAVMLAWYYKDRDEEKFNEFKGDLEAFNQMNVGRRWIRNLGIEMPAEEEAAEETEAEETSEEEPAEEEPAETESEEKE